MSENIPRLRNVNKTPPPYVLNKFPKSFEVKLCEDIVYLLATRGTPDLETIEEECERRRLIHLLLLTE